MEIEILRCDITSLEVDAIVNAANSQLAGGGGVDGAIHRAAGPSLAVACEKIRQSQGGCAPGTAVLTAGGNLKARYVIHTVGPVWHGGSNGEAEVLADCYRSCLALAEANSLKTIAFPNVSTGVYGFPLEKAAKVVREVLNDYRQKESTVSKITFATFDMENYRIYRRIFG
jgi:O-acetyl-ADP-ribose deacetylase